MLEAHALALLGDRASCAVSLHEAERAFDRRSPENEPDWIAYFDEAYLSAKFAHCFRDLGDGAQAVRHARRSLEMDGRYVRGKMFNLSLLPAGLVRSGELEEACSPRRRRSTWRGHPVHPHPVVRARHAAAVRAARHGAVRRRAARAGGEYAGGHSGDHAGRRATVMV